jgi:hypothetical protein
MDDKIGVFTIEIISDFRTPQQVETQLPNKKTNQKKLLPKRQLQQQQHLCPKKSLLPAAVTQHCPKKDFRLDKVVVTVLYFFNNTEDAVRQR